MPRTPPPRRSRDAADALTARSWVEAAMLAIAEGGLEAVAVEPLAARLGVTKGSFYWHFANRQALLEAVLDAWEQQDTEAVILAVEGREDAGSRLGWLLGAVLDASTADAVELALLSARKDPLVGPVLDRVTRRRVDYVTGLYRAAGLDGPTARSQAVTAVSVYLGHVQLAQVALGVLPPRRHWRAHLQHVTEVLAPRRT